jgi:A/G-specific adenine glycosylase
LLDWFLLHARDLPWRSTRDPYAVWVSEIMLQQTQVKTVLPYWQRWMRALPNIQTLAEARSRRIHKLWEGLGYYSRVRNMQKAARAIVETHDGKFPEDFNAILALPGIGRYTAGAICSIAFNQPRPILDGNVIRVLARLFGLAGDPLESKTNSRLWGIAEQLVLASCSNSLPDPAGVDGTDPILDCSAGPAQLNQSLMELGALVCTPREPHCRLCPLTRFCAARKQGRVDQLPSLRPRPHATRQKFVAFVAQKKGQFLVRQRPAGVRNAHLWEFPNIELNSGDSDLKQVARRSLGLSSANLHPLCTIRHSITRYRITLEVFKVTGLHGIRCSLSGGRWLNRRQLFSLPFTSAHRRILHRLGLGNLRTKQSPAVP